jgi:hypothetical protein
MPRSLARLSASESSHRDLSSAVFITNIVESDFRYTQGYVRGGSEKKGRGYRPKSREETPKEGMCFIGSATEKCLNNIAVVRTNLHKSLDTSDLCQQRTTPSCH